MSPAGSDSPPSTLQTTSGSSICSSASHTSEKASLSALDLLSNSKVEAFVSATRNNTHDDEAFISKTGGSTACQSLKNIIHKSSGSPLATSIAKELDSTLADYSTADPETSKTAVTEEAATIDTLSVITAASGNVQSKESAEELALQIRPSSPSGTDKASELIYHVTDEQAERSDTVDRKTSLHTLATWWSGGSTSATISTNVAMTLAQQGPASKNTNTRTTSSPPQSLDSATSKDTPNIMDWEPSGPEATLFQRRRAHMDDSPSSSSPSSSLPSSLPSSAAFPASMIRHTKVASVRERGGSVSSTQSSLTSMLWSKLAASHDNILAASADVVKEPSTEHISSSYSPRGVQTMTMDVDQDSLNGLVVASSSAKGSESPFNSAKKRWSLFGYGTKEEDDFGSPSTKLRKSGDVLIEPESRPSSVKGMISSASNSPRHDTTAQLADKASKAGPFIESGPFCAFPVKTEVAQSCNESGPVAPALVATTQLNVDVPAGTNLSSSRKDQSNDVTTVASVTYSWLSIIPGYGNKTDDATATKDEMQRSYQVTDYREGQRKDVDGNPTDIAEKANDGRTFAQLVEAETSKEGLASEQDIKDVAKERQTFAQLKEREQANGNVTDAGKAVASLSKVILKKKNMVLPNYYEQYPEVHTSLITVPVGHGEVSVPVPGHQRSPSLMKSAVNALSSLLFSKAPSHSTEPSREDALHRGAKGIKKVAIIGVHGWFPVKLIRTVIGEPTGTSKKFCDEMNLALKDYLQLHNVRLDTEDITLIPLEGEGKVLNRVDLLYRNLMKDEGWKSALHEADLVLVATHSQGTPTSTLLVARLIEEGILRVQENDPKMQRVGVLAMAGISHGPFPSLKGNLIVRWFEAEAAQELFEFMDSDTAIAKKYREALRIVLTSGVRFTCVASLEDQVVPLYSAIMTSIHHPSIVRAVYIDGTSYQNDFLTNLISFSLRLRNSGVDDHGVLVHLSEVIAGSIYGEGHSTIYEEREVYLLAIRSLLEPPLSLTSEKARSEPVLHPFRAKHTLNPFYLPWGMRGVMDEIKVRGDEVLNEELERLKRLYDEWNPVSKGMKEIKFRLEPVRSKL